MNKQQLIKISKKIIITIVSIFVLIVLYFISIWIYSEFYLPYYYTSIYKEALLNTEKADSISFILYKSEYKSYNKEIEELLTKSAREGRMSSQVLLGRYYQGYSIIIDESCIDDINNAEKSAYWYQQAANNGNVEAIGKLGLYYEYGIGVKQDFSKAIKLLTISANKEYPLALLKLGNIYYSGLRHYKDYLKGYYTEGFYDGEKFILMDSSSKKILNNHRNRKNCIEYMSTNKLGEVFITPDINKAKYYWKLAANKGNQEAIDALEKIYDEE